MFSLRKVFLLLVAFSFGCQFLDTSIHGSASDPSGGAPVPSPTPTVLTPTLNISTPTLSAGNIGSDFVFTISYENIDSINLLISHISLDLVGTVVCSTPVVSNGTTSAPSISVSNCMGDGSFTLTLAAGSGQSGDLMDTGGVSSSVTIDNTKPLVSVANPSPSSGDKLTNFDFVVNFVNAATINLMPSHILVNDGNCSSPVITNGTSPSPTVTLSNCKKLISSLGITVLAGASLDAVGNADIGSMPSVTASLTNACPSNYLVIPSLAGYTTDAFCLMKYEAKAYDGSSAYDIDGRSVNLSAYEPDSTHSHRPWVEINRNNAITECRNLNSESGGDIETDTAGDGTYDLITNDQWQSLVRNIELVPTNWEDSVVGGVISGGGGTVNNQINHGHSDNSPGITLAASIVDADACFGTGQAVSAGTDDSCTGVGWPEKRTHTLSTGQEIWDVAGNVWEWVKDDNANDYGSIDYFAQITAGTPFNNSYSLSNGTTTVARNAKDQFGPSGDYTDLNAGYRGGLGFGWLNSTAGAVSRGGDYSNIAGSGLFATYLYFGSASALLATGFRCVYF